MFHDRLNPILQEKYRRLRRLLSGYGRLAIAYSGGVDSALLLAVASEVLGEEALGIIGDSPSLPRRELREATELARKNGWHYVVLATHETEQADYRRNPYNRCYFCKRELFTEFLEYARKKGYRYIADGTNVDDGNDYRPGLQAIQELQVVSPLKEAELTKREIRLLARYLGLPIWNKPAQACLASRFPTGTPVTPEAMRQVEAAEDFLLGLGFRVVRVRHHGKLARIEVEPSEIPRLLEEEMRRAVVEHLQSLGYRHVTVDLQGYRSAGSQWQPTEKEEHRYV